MNLKASKKLGADRNTGGKEPRRTRDQVPGIQALIDLEPKFGGGPKPVEPAEVTHLEQKPVKLPQPNLNSVKLVESAQIAKRGRATFKGIGSPARAKSSKTDLRAESLQALGKSNPLWAEILGREAAKFNSDGDSPEPAGEASWSIDESVLREGSSSIKAEIEEDWFFDSPLPLRDYPISRWRRVWRALEAFVRSRQFSQAAAALIVLFFISSLDVPWRSWFGNQLQAARGSIVTAINTLNKPIEERAAFFIAEDFQHGLDRWRGAGGGSPRIDPSGLMRVSGLALHEGTLNLVDYRLDFNAKIQSHAVGWVVRAADYSNYYSFKLIESGGGNSKFHLERYAVIDGAKGRPPDLARIELPPDLAKTGIFNRISLRVRDDQITTMINGWGVDFWRDSRLPRGGVGLLASAGEAAFVEKMTIAGNDDTWGLLLYGTSETLRSIRDTISPPVALIRGGFSAPVAIVLQPVPLYLARPSRLPGR